MTDHIVPYACNATFIRNHDGDTISVVVDRGEFDYKGEPDHPFPIRLNGINANELSEPGGPEARDHLALIMADFAASPSLGLYTIKPYKYGEEWVADVIYRDKATGELINLCEQVISCGYAMAWDGTGTAPRFPWPRPQGCVHVPDPAS